MGELLATYFILYLIIYFLPTLVALLFGSNRKGAVFVMNLFLGWTLIGWVLAFIWAVSPKQEHKNVIINNHVSTDRTINPIIAQPSNDSFQQLSNTKSLLTQQEQIEMTTIKSHQDKISHLQQLKQLLDAGILTQEEFDQQKTQILAL